MFLVIIVTLLMSYTSHSLCPLSWVQSSNGSLAENAVHSASIHYIARGVLGNSILPGNLEKGDGLYIEAGWGKQFVLQYEVLTNTNKCILKWVESCCSVPTNAVNAGYELGVFPNVYVGRKSSNFIPGKINEKDRNYGFYYAYNDGFNVDSKFEWLTSSRVNVTIVNMKYALPSDTDLSGYEKLELIGNNIISNDASTALQKTVRFRKSLTNSYSFKLSQSFTHSANIRIDFKIPFDLRGEEYSYEFVTNKTEENTKIQTKESLIEFEANLTVKPYSTVNVTGIVKIIRNFQFPFTGRAKYYFEAMTGQQIKELFGNDFNGNNVVINNDALYTDISGVLTGEFVISNHESIQEIPFISKINSTFCPLIWVSSKVGFSVDKAVHSSGNHYIARAFVDNHLLPGNLEKDKGVYIEFMGKQLITSYEVLTNPNNCALKWVVSCCSVPENAVEAGTQVKEKIFVGRDIAGHIPGKIHGDLFKLFWAYQSGTASSDKFEWLTSSINGLTETNTRVKNSNEINYITVLYIVISCLVFLLVSFALLFYCKFRKSKSRTNPNTAKAVNYQNGTEFSKNYCNDESYDDYQNNEYECVINTEPYVDMSKFKVNF